MNSADRPYHHGELRFAIIDEAARLIAAEAQWSLRDICKKIGVSHTAAYAHFSSKADIVAAVADREVMVLLNSVASATTLPESLEAFYRHFHGRPGLITLFPPSQESAASPHWEKIVIALSTQAERNSAGNASALGLTLACIALGVAMIDTRNLINTDDAESIFAIANKL